MAKFVDQLGREWVLKIDVPMLPRLREAGFNVGRAVRDPKELEALDDPELLGKVLWVLVEVQAAKASVDPEGFAAGFDGPTIFAAIDAFSEAIVDFSQRPAVATAIKAKLPAVIAKLEQAAVAKIEAMTSGSNAIATNSPAASAASSPPWPKD